MKRQLPHSRSMMVASTMPASSQIVCGRIRLVDPASKGKGLSGDVPPIASWDAADRAARTIYRAGGPTLRVGGMYTMRAAYHSIALADTDHWATLDAVTGYALRAHTQATGGVRATPIVKLTRHAIRSWRG
jgi:hypothetical protein